MGSIKMYYHPSKRRKISFLGSCLVDVGRAEPFKPSWLLLFFFFFFLRHIITNLRHFEFADEFSIVSTTIIFQLIITCQKEYKRLLLIAAKILLDARILHTEEVVRIMDWKRNLTKFVWSTYSSWMVDG